MHKQLGQTGLMYIDPQFLIPRYANAMKFSKYELYQYLLSVLFHLHNFLYIQSHA